MCVCVSVISFVCYGYSPMPKKPQHFEHQPSENNKFPKFDINYNKLENDTCKYELQSVVLIRPNGDKDEEDFNKNRAKGEKSANKCNKPRFCIKRSRRNG